MVSYLLSAQAIVTAGDANLIVEATQWLQTKPFNPVATLAGIKADLRSKGFKFSEDVSYVIAALSKNLITPAEAEELARYIEGRLLRRKTVDVQRRKVQGKK